jgi:hypothetical protein
MSQVTDVRSGLPDISDPAGPHDALQLWKRRQIAYVVGRAVFLIGFFFLMEHRHDHDAGPLLSTALGNRMVVQAFILLAVGTFFEMGLFALINWWESKRPESGVVWRVFTVLGSEALLWVSCFLPVFYVMFLGPAAVEIMNILSRN